MRLSSELLISMDSQGPRARKLIGQFASRMGFKHDGVSKIDDCVNELILHLMNDHTRSGILGFKDFADNGTRGIELTTLTGRNGDRRKEWKQSLYALKRRAAAEVRIESSKEICSVSVKKYLGGVKRNECREEENTSVAVCIHPAKENSCESYVVHEDGSRILIGLIDGGEKNSAASDAATLAELFLYENCMKPLERILRELKAILIDAPGAGISLARFDEQGSQIQFSAIGGLAARLWKPDEYRWADLVGVDGVSGSSFRMSYNWTEGSILVMHSKDISGNWELSPSERLLSAQELASLLIKRKSGPGEATVMVVR